MEKVVARKAWADAALQSVSVALPLPSRADGSAPCATAEVAFNHPPNGALVCVRRRRGREHGVLFGAASKRCENICAKVPGCLAERGSCLSRCGSGARRSFAAVCRSVGLVDSGEGTNSAFLRHVGESLR